MKVGFVSLGCSKNLVDSERLLAIFTDRRFEIEKNPELCDVIFINTCGFILAAKQEAIDTILEMAEYKKKKLKKLIVTGCFVQRYYEELKKEFPEVDCFIRVDDYSRIGEILQDVLHMDYISSDLMSRVLLTPSYYGYLKIAEGCNHRCAYCAIPLIRGNFVSEPMEKLLSEAQKMVDAGVLELNIIAQDSANYGRDLYGKYMLKDLLTALNELPFRWIRILYMYPDEMSEELLRTMKSLDKVLPYFDMPVQYGSDAILRRMRRPTSVQFLRDKFALIHRIFEGKEVLRTTFMVGFPGETEEDFLETLAFIREQRFDSLGAFTYSLEEDTPAYDMPNQIDEAVKEERYQRLMQVQREVIDEKNRERIGKVYDVLVEANEPLLHRSKGRAYFSAPEGVDPAVYIENAGNLTIGEWISCEIVALQDYDFIARIKEK